MKDKAKLNVRRPAVVFLVLGTVAILATGCFKPAAAPLQPTVTNNAGPTKTVPLPATATLSGTAQAPGRPTVPPIVQTTTSVAATLAATGIALPTQPPGLQPTFDPYAPTVDPNLPTLVPTPTSLVPSAQTPTQPLGGGDGSCMYTVQPGENLFRLSLRWETSVEAITTLNGIANPDTVAAGTVLRIPGCGAGAAPAATLAPGGTGSARTYTVQTGDTLFSIARRFGVSVQDIIDANPALQTDPDRLRVGQEIAIP